MLESCKGIFFIFLTFSFLLVLSSSVSAICLVSLDKDINYSGQETAVATGSCTIGADKLQPCNWVWRNASQIFKNETCITPNVVGENFFSSFTFPDGTNPMWLNANVTLYVNDAFNDAVLFNVSGTSISSLRIIDVNISQDSLVNKEIGVIFSVIDFTDKSVSNARCDVHVENIEGDHIDVSTREIITYDVMGAEVFLINPSSFEEDKDFLIEVHCSCGPNSTSRGCFNQDGIDVSDATGSGEKIFNVGHWLTVNTKTDKLSYTLADKQIDVCANVTYPHTDIDRSLDITYSIRCDVDDNQSLERNIIDSGTEKRAIGKNTTQTQCKLLNINNIKTIQNTVSPCYAVTHVNILSADEEKVMYTYNTRSPIFTISSNSNFLNLGGNTMVVILFLILCFAAFFIWVGIYKEDGWSLLLSAFLIVFVGVYVMRFGIDPLNDDLTRTFAVILIGLGAYIGFRGIEGTGFGEAFPRFGGKEDE